MSLQISTIKTYLANQTLALQTDNTTRLSIASGGLVTITGDLSAQGSVFSSDVVNVKAYGATGDGTTDDTAAIQAALDSGSKMVVGNANDTYIINHTSNIVIGSTNYPFCLSVPSGVTFDLGGSTLKRANAQNSSVVCLSGVTGSRLINGVIDGNQANQTAASTGEMACILVYNCTDLRIEDIKATNVRQYAGRFLDCTGGRFVNLRCTDSDGDGWGFGVSDWRIIDSFIDEIHAENCTGNENDGWGGEVGNGVIFTTKQCTVGKVLTRACAAGIKIQDASEDSTFGSLTFIGDIAGVIASSNSGVKIQGSDSLRPTRIKIDSIHSLSAEGNGLYIYYPDSLEIGKYQGYRNGTGPSSSGSNEYDFTIHVPVGGRIQIGSIDTDSPDTAGGRVIGAGFCKIDNVFSRNPTGAGLYASMDEDSGLVGTLSGGELHIDTLRVEVPDPETNDTMTWAFKATGGRGRINSISTNVPHSTTQARVTLPASALNSLYDWTIGTISLSSNDVLEGVVQLTNSAASTDVACSHISREYAGTTSADTYFGPVIVLVPMNSTTRALGSMNAIPIRTINGTGFSIEHATAGASDYVYWYVQHWKTMARAFA